MKSDFVLALLNSMAHGYADVEHRAMQVACSMPASQAEAAKALVEKMRGRVATLPPEVAGWVETIDPVSLDALVLPGAARRAALSAAEEAAGRERLAEFGLRPRSRVLVEGPPGTGKTSLAGTMGALAGLPAYRVRLASIVASYMGETGGRIVKLFEALRRHPGAWVLDEVESIAGVRGGVGDGSGASSESMRMTNALLSALDGGTGASVVVATTNRADLVDPAVLRRFDCRLALAAPDAAALEAQAAKLVYRFCGAGLAGRGDGLAWQAAAREWAKAAANHAHVAHAFEAVARDVALGRAPALTPDAVSAEVWPLVGGRHRAEFRAQRGTIVPLGGRSNGAAEAKEAGDGG